MTEQVSKIGRIILETLESLIHVNISSMDETEFLSKHAVMKQHAVKSIFEHFLSDPPIETVTADHCYRILQEVCTDEREREAETGAVLMQLVFVSRSTRKIAR